MNQAKHTILKTLAWFQVLDRPLTLPELYQYLLADAQSYSHGELAKILEEMVADNVIHCVEGQYCLSDGAAAVLRRKKRYIVAERKYKRVIKVCRLLKYIPWIKMISVCNTLGLSNAREDSDIDIFIVTTAGRVWTTRFFVVSILQIFGLRPLLASFGTYPEYRRDRIDASFFIDENSLSIEELLINDDIYLWYWIILQTPIYDQGSTYQQFVAANEWITKYLPNALHSINYPSPRRRVTQVHKAVSRLLTLFNYLISERFSKWIQLQIMPTVLKVEANTSTNVVINDSILKFHHKDTRITHTQTWQKYLQQLPL